LAITKTHPIKSTLKDAIDYICNPNKTDGKLLVSSYGCATETADIEFTWTRQHAIDKGTNLGRHLIQAFEPGEVSPEGAYEIGMQLAKEILGGNMSSSWLHTLIKTMYITIGGLNNIAVTMPFDKRVSILDLLCYNKKDFRSCMKWKSRFFPFLLPRTSYGKKKDL